MTATPLETVLRRDRAIVVAALAVLTALAWVYIVLLANSVAVGGVSMGDMPMQGSSGTTMNMGGMLAPAFKPWTVLEFTTTFAMWAVMMVGMMTPSAAPMILIYARVGRQATLQGKPFAATGFFAGGYLLAWCSFSLVATVGQWALDRAALLTPMMTTASNIFGGLVLVVAGLFQWSPLKDICLKQCQAPLNFIQHHGGFRSDALGSLVIGFRHGTYCVGCCWALMVVLFVVGLMNVVWIAVLAIFVLLEKIIPLGRIVSRAAGAALTIWGVWLVAFALR